jgi:prepilin-type processing-associated H-X9-DG protein
MSNLTTGGCCQYQGNVDGKLVGNAVTSGNAALMADRIRLLECPSDNGVPFLAAGATYGPGGNFQGAKTNYDFIVSVDDIYCNYWKVTPLSQRTMFGQNSTTRVADVTDGTSNTLALGETTLNVYNGRTAAWGYRGWVMTGIDVGDNEGINNWSYTTLTGPITPVRGQLGSWGRAGSLHPNGANFCFADGSVRFLTEDIDNTTLQHLAWMADGFEVAVP